jgi:hypothetical protein
MNYFVALLLCCCNLKIAVHSACNVHCTVCIIWTRMLVYTLLAQIAHTVCLLYTKKKRSVRNQSNPATDKCKSAALTSLLISFTILKNIKSFNKIFNRFSNDNYY